MLDNGTVNEPDVTVSNNWRGYNTQAGFPMFVVNEIERTIAHCFEYCYRIMTTNRRTSATSYMDHHKD